MGHKRIAPGRKPGAAETLRLAALVSIAHCTPLSPLAQTLNLLQIQAERLAQSDRDQRRRRKHARLARFLRGWLASWGAEA